MKRAKHNYYNENKIKIKVKKVRVLYANESHGKTAQFCLSTQKFA